jgi:nucleoside 2-deoxyribosyltransferase
MIIVGGSYIEQVGEPRDLQPGGSGLRAVTALAAVAKDLKFVTAADNEQRSVVAALTAGLGVKADIRERNLPVVFSYWTPVFSPWFETSARVAHPIEVEGDQVLAYAMVEGDPVVRAECVVLDPQGRGDIESVRCMLDGSTRRILVANENEALALSADQSSLPEAVSQLRHDLELDALVVKRGVRGAVVAVGTGTTKIPSLPTDRVWPFGSGDVFSGAFAHAYFEGKTAVHAAAVASHAASVWCRTRAVPLPADAHMAVDNDLRSRPGTVYLAGPLFTLPQRNFLQFLREALENVGVAVFSPLEDVGLADTAGDATGAVSTDTLIADKDLAGLEASSAVFAWLDGLDAGTLFEVGWAQRCEIPVIAYLAEDDPRGLTMVRGAGAEIHHDLSTAIYRAAWAATRVT